MSTPIPPPPHPEHHRSGRSGWLRAAVLGANDGLISTSSLLVGVAAAAASADTLLMTGVASLAAGALSMAAGEYVSVSSQADTEQADRALEATALDLYPQAELEELTRIYIERGLEPALARQVAEQLTAHDALGAHLRDELHLSEIHAARPLQAALASAAAFAVGAAPPILLTLFAPREGLSTSITAMTLLLLAVLGASASRLGGAPIMKGAARVVIWGALAMAATALIGRLFGAEIA